MYRSAVYRGRGEAIPVPGGERAAGTRKPHLPLLRRSAASGDAEPPAADRGHGPGAALAGAELQRAPGRLPGRPAAGQRCLRRAAVHRRRAGQPGPAVPLRRLRRRPPGRPRRCLAADRQPALGRLPAVREHHLPADAAAAGAGRPEPAIAPMSSAGRYLIRDAGPGDLDAIAAFEAEIARVSFGDEAVTDLALHRRRVAAALGRPGEVTLVAVPAGGAGRDGIVGWAWLSARTNSLTGDRYGNFRSLAAADLPDRPLIGELLLDAVIRAEQKAGLTRLTGKVHAGNLGM